MDRRIGKLDELPNWLWASMCYKFYIIYIWFIIFMLLDYQIVTHKSMHQQIPCEALRSVVVTRNFQHLTVSLVHVGNHVCRTTKITIDRYVPPRQNCHVYTILDARL
jgi:hypothetical protein